VVGLGNPGRELAGTRHNLGADAVRVVAERKGADLRAEKGQRAILAEVTIGSKRVALAVPTAYVNESGDAVRPLMRRFGIKDPAALVVVHDELDLPPGRLRVKVGGGTGGHNGLRSIQAHIHSADFVRVRLGIGKPRTAEQGADHVLSRPARRERELLEEVTRRAADAVEDIATDGVDAAMNRWNSG
jgi:peptidyl-tRNA hydrolase, PTH1 family